MLLYMRVQCVRTCVDTGVNTCVYVRACGRRVKSGIISIVLFPANILLNMHPISPT